MLKFKLLLLKSVKNDVHGNMQTIIISVDITELNDYWIGNNYKFCPSLKKIEKTKEDQDKDAYPSQGNFSLSCGLLYKAPSYVNATFLCRVAKIVHTPLKETSPCRVDFCTKRHHMSTRHFFVALPKNSYPPSKKHCFVS